MLGLKKIPTILSVLRALCVIPLIILLPDYPLPALAVFIVAALTDFLDGFLARKWQAASEFGAFIDPLTDKVIYLGALYALSYSPPIFWILILTFPPEIAMMVIRFEPLKTKFKTIVPATDVGKEKMCLQSAAIIIMMLGAIIDYQLLIIEGMIIASLAIIYSWASLMSHFEQKIKTA